MSRWFLLWVAAALFFPGNPASAQRSAAQGFDVFKLVRTRNIFDPDRRPASGKGAAAIVASAPLDYIALTGTLVTKDKALAFFSGSRADFHKVLPVRETISGATITKITAGNITLERAGKATVVAVGWTVPLNGSASAPAPVAVAAVPPVLATPDASAPSPLAVAAPPGAAPAITAPAPNDDVARRMRERRQQELQ